MDIYLIRHTTPDVPKGTCYGASDVPVTKEFPIEAQAIQAVLPPLAMDARVISSPLIRCKKLADFLVGAETVLVDPQFKEMSFGEWELQLWNAIDKQQLKTWFPNFVTQSPPQGETFQEVFNRATTAFDQYRQQQNTQLWVVAHSAIIRAILAHIQQTPLADAFKAHLDYGVVFHIGRNGVVTQLK